MIGIQKLHREPLSDELQALLFVLRIDREAPDRDRIRGKLSSIDWNQFLELVRHHRVVPWVHTRLQPFPELIPADIRKELHADYRANAFGMLQLAGEMERVGANLDRAGVPCLMLKGPILAETLYGDLSLRTSRDLDLLVPVDAVERAAEQLARMGYEANDSVHRILNDWKWKLHHLSFRHPVKKCWWNCIGGSCPLPTRNRPSMSCGGENGKAACSGSRSIIWALTICSCI
ncbi:hypothetical protein PACILC2_21310 [Paenibacillus cisolokensis]|uniref:Nucleotidyltransferase family protein n=1 Tax=Paenibacillus cisolokensis TaxID=1658519 RepID=A0ABQ4N5T1_9BACL|nr:hypothetical protein PACILC2_21310 [Paenibacillus cisolokensis]